MARAPRKLPGVDLPRNLEYHGSDTEIIRLRDAIDQNFREILNRTHAQIESQKSNVVRFTVLEDHPPLHAGTHRFGGTDEVGTITPTAGAIPYAKPDGTFADGWISESSVTQHQAALAIDWGQLVNTPTTRDGYGITDVYTMDEANSLFAPISHTHHISDLLDFGAAGGLIQSDGSAWTRVDRISYTNLPNVGGTWAVGGDLTTTGGDIIVSRIGAAAGGNFRVSVDTGQTADMVFRTGVLNRWIFRKNATAEAGADVGSDAELRSYRDDGTFNDVVFSVARAAGSAVTLGRNLVFGAENTYDIGNGSVATGNPRIVYAATRLDTLGIMVATARGTTPQSMSQANVDTGAGIVPVFQALNTATAGSAFAFFRFNNGVNNNGPVIVMGRSGSTVIGSFAPVATSDVLGILAFSADDGTNYQTIAARVRVTVDGAPGAASVGINRVPGSYAIQVAPATSDDSISVPWALVLNSLGNARWGDNATISAGSTFELVRTTGSATIVPVAMRLRSRTSASDWVTGPTNIFAKYDIYVDDVSGPGASVRAQWGAFMEDTAGSKVGLAVQVSGSGGLADVVRYFSDLRSQFRGDVIVGQGELGTPVVGVLRGAKAFGSNINGADLFIRPALLTGSGTAGKVRIQGATTSSGTLAPSLWGTAAQSAVSTNTVGTRTVTITVDEGAVNKLLVVDAAMRIAASETITSVVSNIDGAFTNLDSQSNSTNNSRAEIWYLKNPTVGTHTITVTVSVAVRFVAAAQCYQDVDQATPFGTVAKATGNTQNATLNVTSALNELVIDCVAKVNSADAMTAAAGQAEKWNSATSNATTANNVIGGTSYKDGAASVTMSWTWATNNRQWAMLGVALKPAVDYRPGVLTDVLTIENGTDVKVWGAFAANGKTPAALPVYAITNGTTRRTLDADASTPDQIADLVYTILKDLTAQGFGAQGVT